MTESTISFPIGDLQGQGAGALAAASDGVIRAFIIAELNASALNLVFDTNNTYVKTDVLSGVRYVTVTVQVPKGVAIAGNSIKQVLT